MKQSILFIILLFYSCASIDHPKGGPVDQTPPLVLNHLPDSNQINFQKTEIVFRFNEYVEIKDANSIVISPPLANKPEYKIKGKSLYILFKDTLRSNTTYTVQLNNAIQDITEKNILPSHNLSFSTGSHLDTLKISGNVILNQTQEAQKNISVALFHPTISAYPDSQIFPLYTTRTQEDGTFSIQGIAPGNYTLYAFEDINFNNRYETGEKMAYLDTSVHSLDTLEHTLLLANYELVSPYRLGNPIPLGTQHFKLPLIQNTSESLQIKSSKPSFDKTQKIYHHFIHSDTLILFDSYKTKEDSLLQYYLYINEELKDSFEVDYSKTTTPFHEYSISGLKQLLLEPFDTLELHYNEPLLHVDTSKLILIQDSTKRIPIQIANSTYSSYILFNRSYDKNYQLILLPGAFKTTAYTQTSIDTIGFLTPIAENYGSIQIKWEGIKNQEYRVELLKDKSKNPEYTLYSSSDSVYFRNIKAGTYYARISAVSKRSTTRLIPFKQQVEPYYYYPKSLELRGLWTIEDVLIHIHQF